jgi:membrane-anchored mycosin MYCP
VRTKQGSKTSAPASRRHATAVLAFAAFAALALAPAARAQTGIDTTTIDDACQTQNYPTLPPATVPWAQTRLDFERVWPLTRGQGVTVAVLDSGVNAQNAQLTKVQDGGDTYQQGGSGLVDPVGHGTMVAGIIAAHQAAGVTFAGVAPDAHLISIKIVADDCRSRHDVIANAILSAVNLGASVINISAAAPTLDPALADAVQKAENAGVVIVAAAGNDAHSDNVKYYPASYPGVIAVGSVDPDGARSSFDTSGTQVTVAAPGSDIVSTANSPGPRLTGGTAAQGTSFAAPYVAGVAALVRSAYPTMSGAEVVKRIEATADHAAGAADPHLGWGTVNPYAAVTEVLPGEAGAQAAVPSPSPVSAPKPVPDTGAHAAARTADLVAFGGVAAAIAVAGAAAALPGARRRRWRAGRWAAAGTAGAASEPSADRPSAAVRSSEGTERPA